MDRRLNTHVHVDGVVYGPASDVPAEVAERITNPNVWDDGDAEPVTVAEAKPPPPRRGNTKKS